MADRTSAEIFGKIFEYLATDPERHKEFAQVLAGFAGEYDFDPYQMYCDEALIKLNLIRPALPEEIEDYGENIYYNNPNF